MPAQICAFTHWLHIFQRLLSMCSRTSPPHLTNRITAGRFNQHVTAQPYSLVAFSGVPSMRNEDISTLTGQRIVDAPALSAQANQNDALTNMLHEIHASRMSQSSGDSAIQAPRNAISNGKCGAIADFDLETSESRETHADHRKPHLPYDSIKPEFRNMPDYGLPEPYDNYNHAFKDERLTGETGKWGWQKPQLGKDGGKKQFGQIDPNEFQRQDNKRPEYYSYLPPFDSTISNGKGGGKGGSGLNDFKQRVPRERERETISL